MNFQAAKEFLDAFFFKVKGYAIGPCLSLLACGFPFKCSQMALEDQVYIFFCSK